MKNQRFCSESHFALDCCFSHYELANLVFVKYIKYMQQTNAVKEKLCLVS